MTERLLIESAKIHPIRCWICQTFEPEMEHVETKYNFYCGASYKTHIFECSKCNTVKVKTEFHLLNTDEEKEKRWRG